MSDELTNAPTPESGDRIDWDQTLGKLLIVEPRSQETGIDTVHGASDAIRADVHVITGPGTAENYSDVLIFPRILQSQLKGQIGKKVVGRLGKGDPKPGKSAPWVLNAATEEDLGKAREWLNAIPKAPVVAATAPSGDPWAAPSQAQAAAPF